jgi:hypothetical protein
MSEIHDHGPLVGEWIHMTDQEPSGPTTEATRNEAADRLRLLILNVSTPGEQEDRLNGYLDAALRHAYQQGRAEALDVSRLAEGLRDHFHLTLVTECPDVDFDYDECARRIRAAIASDASEEPSDA